MNDWSKKTRGVEPKEVHFCRLCGAEIVQLNFSGGDPYWTDVQRSRDNRRIVILGEGNNYNFKPQHNCLKVAENHLRLAEATYKDFSDKYTAAKTTVESIAAADADLIARKAMEGDKQLVEVLTRVRESAKTNLASLEAQKPAMDQYFEYARTNVELLRQQKCIVPADKPVLGRTAKVVKGRKVPKGTQGTIIYLGLDQYKEDGVRVGIEANGQRYYTSAENIKVVNTQPA